MDPKSFANTLKMYVTRASCNGQNVSRRIFEPTEYLGKYIYIDFYVSESPLGLIEILVFTVKLMHILTASLHAPHTSVWYLLF